MQRTEMEHDVRECLLDALLVELGEKGYGEWRSTPLCASPESRRRTSRTNSSTSTSALFAAYEQLTDRLTDQTKEAAQRPGTHGHGGLWRATDAADKAGRQAGDGARPDSHLPLDRARERARYQGFIEEFAPLLREGRE